MRIAYCVIWLTLAGCMFDDSFERGNKHFAQESYAAARENYLQVSQWSFDYAKAQAKIVEIDSIAEKQVFDNAVAFFEKEQYKEAQILFSRINVGSDLSSECRHYLQALDSLKGKIADQERLQHREDLVKARLEAKRLFDELLAFKDEDKFKESGFGQDARYHRWLAAVQQLKIMPGSGGLRELGFVPGDLEMLGLEYARSRGRETKYSSWAKKTIKNGLAK